MSKLSLLNPYFSITLQAPNSKSTNFLVAPMEDLNLAENTVFLGLMRPSIEVDRSLLFCSINAEKLTLFYDISLLIELYSD